MYEPIGILEIFTIVKRRLFWVVVAVFLGISGAYALTEYMLTPLYTSSTNLLVSHPYEENQIVSLGEIESNIQLINTYRDIIEDPVILDHVIADMDSPMSIEELRKKIKVLIQSDSQIFGIEVTDTNPDRAADLADSIAETFQQNVGEILRVENVAILSPARINRMPTSPNGLFNLVIGGMIGFLTGILVSVIHFLIDKKVHNEKILFEILDWTNLGSISRIVDKDTKSSEHTFIYVNNTKKELSIRREEAKNVS